MLTNWQSKLRHNTTYKTSEHWVHRTNTVSNHLKCTKRGIKPTKCSNALQHSILSCWYCSVLQFCYKRHFRN